MASEHKPGDRVLVERQVECLSRDVIQTKPIAALMGCDHPDHVHPHPGIDPARMPVLVATVVDLCDEISKHQGRADTPLPKDITNLADNLFFMTLAARMDLPAGTKEGDDA